jgi:N-acetylmuramoyl-L-alanine amidase/type II secretory pathway predicted ATPase ExeA
MILDFFHLREQPFGVTPNPAYLYPTQTHCAALDALTEAILDDHGFVALIAQPGLGKTTLLYQVLEGLRGKARAAFVFQTQCDSREFFQYLLSDLGVDSTGMGLVAMHNKLNEMLFVEMLAGKRFVLIIDEAQNLDDSVLETIRLLSNFETTNSKLLQIILSGQPQLGKKLGQLHLTQLLQRITMVKYLEALSPEETTGYIRHRLKVAGHRGEPLFEPEALALIAERSQGIPRNINKICFRALLEAYGRGRHTVSADIVEKAHRNLNLPAPASPAPNSTRRPIPAAIPLPSPTRVPANTDFKLTARHSARPQMNHNSPVQFRVPAWGLWAGALVAFLSTAALALPGDFLRNMKKVLRNPVAATKNVADNGRAPDDRELAVNRGFAAAGLRERGIPNVASIQATSTKLDARVVVLLDDAVQFDSARISSPDRIYFDLHKARLRPLVGQKTVPVEDGLLKAVRAAQFSDDVVRLVLDADGAKDYSAQLLSDPYRLVIDVHTQPLPTANLAVGSDAATHRLSQPLREAFVGHPPQPSLARELGLKINRIAIDPGHGGYDTGTTGPHGLLEKDLCLDVALRLGQLIEENISGAEVVYTRKDDRHVSLEERTAIANAANADLFLSIHANSSDFRGARGVETYYLSLATSQESRELASRENALAQSSLHDLPDLISKIARNEKTAESKLLAVDIQNTLSQRLRMVSGQETNRGVKQAPFVVLTGANMPAVLSEISFVSNASDETLLLESGQRQRVAEGLYRGIAAYLDGLHSLPRGKQKLLTENHPGTASSFEASPATAGGNPH